MKVALSIAGSDSSGGAGIQADLAVFRDMGVYGVCAVTTVLAESSTGVGKICKVPPRVVTAQIDAVARDFEIGACKIGVLYSARVVNLVAERIHRRGIPNVVLDPVMGAKHGEVLLTPQARKRLVRALLPKVTLVTPNAHEAEALTGIAVHNVEDARNAARALIDMGPRCALVKGGHIDGEPVDVFYDGTDFHEYSGSRSEKNMHGTGCVLSSAIAAQLALGRDIRGAVGSAKEYVSQAIESAVRLGKGGLHFYHGSGFGR